MDQYTSLVIAGAGVKNYATIGALSKLLYSIKNVRRILGVSSGSILATLLAIGCDSTEILKYFDMVDLSRFEIKYSSVYTYYKLLRYNGVHDSAVFREEVIYKILEEKTGNGDITFKEIFKEYGIALVIPTACVNLREMFYYNHESNPNLSVKYAIEQSCCIPGLFYPVKYKGNTLVDGGVIDNYPLYYFNNDDKLPNSRIKKIIPRRGEKTNKKTLGILTTDEYVSKLPNVAYLGNDPCVSLGDYLKCIFNTILTTNTRCRIGPEYWENTLCVEITVKIDGVTKMVLDEDDKTKLFNEGVSSATYFINYKK